MKNFLVTLHDISKKVTLWFMSGQLTISEIIDMDETMEIQKCHFLWPCSLTWLGISAMDQWNNLAMGLVLFPIPGLGIFQSNGAEIFDAENH